MDAAEAGAATRLTRLVGFRAWHVKEGCLTSIYREWAWPLLEPAQAQCLCRQYVGPRLPHEPDPMHADPPAPSAKCGLYAYDRLDTLEYFIRDQRVSGPPLIGVVLLWGGLIPGRVKEVPSAPFAPRPSLREPGYQLRAQYGRVLALDKDHPSVRFVRGIDQVEQVSRRYLEAWAADACSGVRYRLD